MMKKLLIAASILLMASSVSFAQDSNERYYNYEILTPQRNNSRTAPKPKVEGWAAERVTEKLDRGVVAVKSAAGGSLKAQRSAALSPHFTVVRSVIAHHEASSHRRLRPKGQIHPESAQSKKY